MIKLSTAQLHMLKSLSRNGWPAELASFCWDRAGGSREEFLALEAAGLTALKDGRYAATPAGRREYDAQRRGHWV